MMMCILIQTDIFYYFKSFIDFMKIAGIDEAGKGPVIGPMCIAGVLIDEEKLHSIKNLGVADSKKLTPKKRKILSHQIQKYAYKIYISEVSALQIDQLRKIKNMNEIMVLAFSNVLGQLHPDKVYVDAADVNADRFGKNLKQEYAKTYPTEASNLSIVSQHQADSIYPIVSAASIIAKVKRDELIKQIEYKMNIEFGSGYPSDPKTKYFLQQWYQEHGELPNFVRHSWKTVENIINLK